MSESTNKNPENTMSVDEIIEARPVDLEFVSYSDLRTAMLEIKRRINNRENNKQLRRLEEQFCYVVREIELRQATGSR